MKYEEPTWDFLKAGKVGGLKQPITIANPPAAVLGSFYSFQKISSSIVGNSTAINVFGQCFRVDQNIALTSVDLVFRRSTIPSGTLVAKIYAMTGTFGTDGKPTGSALATSATIAATSFTLTNAYYTFTFSSSLVLQAGLNYCIVVDVSSSTQDLTCSRGSVDRRGNTFTSTDGGTSYSTSAFSLIHNINGTPLQYSFNGKHGHWYKTEFTLGGATGSVTVQYGNGPATTFLAGAGASTFLASHTTGAGIVRITPSSDFDGTITSFAIYKVS